MRRPDLTHFSALALIVASFGLGAAHAGEKRIEYRYPDRPDVVYTQNGAYRAADPDRPIAFSAFENAVSVADARSVLGKPSNVLQTEAPRRVEAPKSYASSSLTSTAVIPGPAYQPEPLPYVEPRQYAAPEPTTTHYSPSAPYSIQAGAFSSISNADRLAAELSAFGDTRVTQGYSNGRQIFRVMLGEWHSRSDAQPTLRLIKSRGFEGFIADIG
tara:strand:+ start:46058 stop:46702 length:645 start_codon:yes stop_codon:yes gene_type:complete